MTDVRLGSRFGLALVRPTIVKIAGEASNIATFAARFSEPLLLVENDRDPLFFGFLKEPPVDLATLPRDNRLHACILDHVASGGYFYEAVCRWYG